jgi:thiamine biosynthesis protein ThiI
VPIREKDETRAAVPGFRPSHILVHYDEIALKGRNRRRFEKRLAANIEAALEGVGPVRLRRIFGRLLIELEPEADAARAAARLGRVFGVSRFSPALRLAPRLEAAKEALAPLLGGLPARSFAMVCHRVNKQLPFSSSEANRELGAHVQALTGWPVRLDDPELSIYLFFVDRYAYLAFERLAGPGGLPYRSTGKVASLISGGIDSPVATYRILQRGAEAVFIHFHSFPHTSAASQDKVRHLARRLIPAGQTARLHLVPFAEAQHRIIAVTPAPFRVILYRRFMVRAAEAIARREGALALVTGESLGQVASQTLENLDTINRVATLPILRPLIGTHKATIVDEARRIGTFETSIEPHDDCCSFLMPRHPATYSTPEELETAEKDLDVAAMTQELVALAAAEELEGERD